MKKRTDNLTADELKEYHRIRGLVKKRIQLSQEERLKYSYWKEKMGYRISDSEQTALYHNKVINESPKSTYRFLPLTSPDDDFFIKKGNDMIGSNFMFDNVQYKLLTHVLAALQESNFTVDGRNLEQIKNSYVFTLYEDSVYGFANVVLGLPSIGGLNLDLIKTSLKRINNYSFEFSESIHHYRTITVFPDCELRDGKVKIRVYLDFFKYIQSLSKKYTTLNYRILYELSNGSVYSSIIYEILKRQAYKFLPNKTGTFKIYLSEFKKNIGIVNVIDGKEKFDNVKDLKKRILNPVQKEINTKSDVYFEYEISRTKKNNPAEISFTVDYTRVVDRKEMYEKQDAEIKAKQDAEYTAYEEVPTAAIQQQATAIDMIDIEVQMFAVRQTTPFIVLGLEENYFLELETVIYLGVKQYNLSQDTIKNVIIRVVEQYKQQKVKSSNLCVYLTKAFQQSQNQSSLLLANPDLRQEVRDIEIALNKVRINMNLQKLYFPFLLCMCLPTQNITNGHLLDGKKLFKENDQKQVYKYSGFVIDERIIYLLWIYLQSIMKKTSTQPQLINLCLEHKYNTMTYEKSVIVYKTILGYLEKKYPKQWNEYLALLCYMDNKGVEKQIKYIDGNFKYENKFYASGDIVEKYYKPLLECINQAQIIENPQTF